MNKKDKEKITALAKFVLKEWDARIKEAKGDPWYYHDARQVYHDCLNAMKHFKLIKDYNVLNMEVTL